jgi:hypothetical protein
LQEFMNQVEAYNKDLLSSGNLDPVQLNQISFFFINEAQQFSNIQQPSG